MNPAWISLAALIIAITLSMVTSGTWGVVSAFCLDRRRHSWMETAGDRKSALFPSISSSISSASRCSSAWPTTTARSADAARRRSAPARGNAGVMLIMFFVIAVTLASIGPGNHATTAIMALMAMAVACARRSRRS
jgi:hypothetical protein